MSGEVDNVDVLIMGIDQDDERWVLELGCTFHKCPRKEWFFDFREIKGGNVYLGDNTVCEVIGIENIQFKMHDGVLRIMRDAHSIPTLKRNHISLGQLDSIGLV